MDYRKIFSCNKCSKYFKNECAVKERFENGNPSTSPFLCCPFYEFNYNLIIPNSGNFYIFDNGGVLYTPIFADLETSKFFDLRKCEVYYENNLTHLVLDMSYPYLLRREKTDIITNGTLIRIDEAHIKK